MSKKKNNQLIQKYSKHLSIAFFLVAIIIYYLVGFINNNYPTYENPALFQALYSVLATLALGCFIMEIILLVRHNKILWKITSLIFSILTLYVTIICLLGIASVNFF